MSEEPNLTVLGAVDRLLSANKPKEASQEPEKEKQETAEAPDRSTEADEPAPEADEAESAEADDADDSEAEEKQPELYTVKIDGKEERVTLEELLGGYQRTKDYTQKTQRLSEEAKALQAEKAATDEARKRYSDQLAGLEAILTKEDPQLEKLKALDPARYLLARQERLDALAAIKQEQQRVGLEQSKAMQAQMAKHIEAERAKVLTAIPAWKDQKRASEEQAAIVSYARNLGFSDQELAGLTDSRAVIALRKAWLYDKGQELRTQKKAPPPSQTIGAGKTSNRADGITAKRDRAVEQLRKSGKVEDAVKVLLASKRK